MIFKANEFESNRERNLYYKFFAGYFFNELIEGVEKRKAAFCDLLISKVVDFEKSIGSEKIMKEAINSLNTGDFAVTFDFHSSQIIDEDKRNDRGEMSDVLLISKTHFISIECKFLSNLSFGKDILEVQERIIKIKKEFQREPIQLLLIKKIKWDNIVNSQKKGGSFFTLFHKNKTQSDIPVIVIHWEELLALITNNAFVSQYFEKQFKRIK